MINKYTNNTTLNNQDYSSLDLTSQDFDQCIFNNCSFQSSQLLKTSFIECEFNGCDFSTANLQMTGFKKVIFRGCKLLGLQFNQCNTFLLELLFDDCILDFASFYKLSLKGLKIQNCSLKEVDFTEANLQGVIFNNCDLTGAIFKQSNLEKVDFRTARNFSIDPEENRIRDARFFQGDLEGLLYKYNIKVE